MTDKKTSVEKTMIRELADLLNETDLTEIEIEKEGLRLRVARMVTMASTVAPAAAALPGANASAAPAPTPADADSHPGAVPSPMVGTAYLAPEPGKPPFVEVGSSVTEGQTIMIVEAMKTMNQIPAPRTGRITAILVEDGHPVEFGAPLVIIE